MVLWLILPVLNVMVNRAMEQLWASSPIYSKLRNSKRLISRNLRHTIKGRGTGLLLLPFYVLYPLADDPQQRRLTALELITLKIPHVMLCDSMVGSLFQHKAISGIGTSSVDLDSIAHTPTLTSSTSRRSRQNRKEW